MEKTVNALAAGTVLRGGVYSYRLLRVLGQGGFGITYLAEVVMQGPLDAKVRVAVKEFFMREVNGREGSTVTSGANNGVADKYKKKFEGEAEKLAKLSNEHIVKVVERFEANGTVYYAMEYIDGGSLDQLIATRGALPEVQVLRYTRQIGEALQTMHAAHMLHLDLKPGNVMVRDDSSVVLIDFGLSKQYDDAGNPESSTTIGGGTPGYAPLEQTNYNDREDIHHHPVTMDVYALGATMLKMLTGERPPRAHDILNDGFPDEWLSRHHVSAATAAAVRRAMSPTRKQRYQSVGEMLAALPQPNPKPVKPVVSDDTVMETMRKTEPDRTVSQRTEHADESTPKPQPRLNPKALYFAGALILAIVLGIVFMNNGTTATTGDHRLNGMIDGHEYVDLGLPSGLKWATCNIGAENPESYGDYFAWGETKTKNSFTDDNCATWNKTISEFAGNSGFDAATANWGIKWRMPTTKDFKELEEYCDYDWTGNGAVFTSKINGANLYLPAAGFRGGTGSNCQGSNGSYWSASPSSDTEGAWYLYFHDGGSHVFNDSRLDCGFPVRPVAE